MKKREKPNVPEIEIMRHFIPKKKNHGNKFDYIIVLNNNDV